MDTQVRNPFKPTAGKTPPEIIGRDGIVDDFVDGLENGPGAPGRLMRISGARGTGKTVMLTELANIAREYSWTVVNETAGKNLLRRIIDQLSPENNLSAEVSPSLSVGPVGVKLGTARFSRRGHAPSVRDAMDRFFESHRFTQGLLVTIDEVQAIKVDDLAEIAAAVQHEIREERDIAFVFAGLPSMVSSILQGNTMTFLRRAVEENVGSIGIGEIALSMGDTIRDSGMDIDPTELETMAQATRGYPFMIQLVGYHTWQAAFRRMGRSLGTIVARDVEQGTALAHRNFDSSVIEPALDRLPAPAIRFLLAMAEDKGPSLTGEVARRMNRTTSYASTYRKRLMHEGIVESPRRGVVVFSIPYMDEYLRSHRDDLLETLEALGAE